MENQDYNYLVKVEYSNNTEYRDCFRKVFHFDMEKIIKKMEETYDDFNNFDEETKDELMIDNDKINIIMDKILEKTQNIDTFRELYKKAAAVMFSTDINIGLSVLFSYDYFRDFHLILVDLYHFINNDFINNENDMDDFSKKTNDKIMVLINRFIKK